jgi:hypothetical protein
MELEERYGGPMWIDDFGTSTAVLNSDMELWVRVERIEQHLQDEFGDELTDNSLFALPSSRRLASRPPTAYVPSSRQSPN